MGPAFRVRKVERKIALRFTAFTSPAHATVWDLAVRDLANTPFATKMPSRRTELPPSESFYSLMNGIEIGPKCEKCRLNPARWKMWGRVRTYIRPNDCQIVFPILHSEPLVGIGSWLAMFLNWACGHNVSRFLAKTATGVR